VPVYWIGLDWIGFDSRACVRAGVDKRKAEAERIKSKYNDRIPVSTRAGFRLFSGYGFSVRWCCSLVVFGGLASCGVWRVMWWLVG
jgi:hypothetical protein